MGKERTGQIILAYMKERSQIRKWLPLNLSNIGVKAFEK
jgi:hypothetical protein